LGYGGLGYGGLGLGAGLMGGLAGWGLGSMLYNYGYSNYMNPYYSSTIVAQQPIVMASPYDYANPINTMAAPPAQTATDAAEATFAQARDAFKAGDYTKALELTNQALQEVPNDTALHEFRALVLFAMKQYDQAAASLYAVLSVGPGWDWTTMIGLYPSVDVYTEQLRALEDYSAQNPQSAPAHFVLAYHYLTEGFTDQAVAQLKHVAELQPNDKLAPQLIRQFTKSATTETANAAQPNAAQPNAGQPGAPPEQPPATAAAGTPPAAPSVKPGELAGTWTAKPSNDTSITLTVDKNGNFTWKVDNKGKEQEFKGESTYGNDLLTLAQTEGPVMVGKLAWQTQDRFNFRVSNAPEDPGLTFTRS